MDLGVDGVGRRVRAPVDRELVCTLLHHLLDSTIQSIILLAHIEFNLGQAGEGMVHPSLTERFSICQGMQALARALLQAFHLDE